MCADLIHISMTSQVFGTKESNCSRQLEIVVEEESEEVELFESRNCIARSPGRIWLTKGTEVPSRKTDHGTWKVGEERIDGADGGKVGDCEEADAVLKNSEDGRVEGCLLGEGVRRRRQTKGSAEELSLRREGRAPGGDGYTIGKIAETVI